MSKNVYNKESDFQKAVNIYLKDKGFFFHPTDLHLKGIPDIIGVCNGKFVAIELKVKGRSPSLLQQITLNQIKEQGGEAYVARTMREVEQIIEKLKE